jgi:HEAT repeat protein
LEDKSHNFRNSSHESPAVETQINVLVRIDRGVVDKIQSLSASCRLNAGGLPFTWLTDVKDDDSVAWLSSLVDGTQTGDNRQRADQALVTISMHATKKATEALAGFASSRNPLWLREKAAFWLGAGRGHEGLLALEKLVGDNDPAFRKKLVFDFSISHDPPAVDDLIRMAKSDADTHVREEAIFWAGQKASKKTMELLKDTVVNDPEEGVKKKALFAISQLPKDEAVPALMHVAQTNPDPRVRKDAIFWLGQTHDPRALAYFEQILLK